MRYQRIPRWTMIMLVVMGLGFVAGSIAFVLFVPEPTGAIVGAIWFVMGGGMAFFAMRSLRGSSDDDRIRREGTAATATLLSATTTGWTINSVPQWKLRLRIDGLGASYETTLKLLTFTPPENGATFGVRVDPLKRDHVVLTGDDGAPGASGAAAPSAAPQVQAAVLDTVRLLADLDRMRASGSLTDTEFESIKAKLLARG